MKSLGAVVQIGAFLALIGAVPYMLISAWWTYELLSSGTSSDMKGFYVVHLLFTVALVVGLWRLRRVGLRLRSGMSGRAALGTREASEGS
jgi:hypothetical protein